ncbi:serine/threonine-protein kinase [Sanguibacter sp. Leaf3]|uniref:serine/threonine-protein kinase n=1 Tax=Sanguibacter sp. Leaf3 TaxID=1736209 RepID=UPI000AF72280|nr:serine/threonine-protein kinase [Sanguibacter sp. Leaf3]
MSARRQPSVPPKIPGYEFVRLLGMGGFADVFEYRQELPRRSVAVKVLLSGSLDQEAREAFFAEANVMAQLSHHPSIVTVYHADIASDGRPYLVMEYCSRPGLGTRYRMERFTVAEVLRTGIRVASAVEAAHHLGILHRDIKPANILATDFGWPALTDFGIASTLGSSAAATGMSIPWAAPELLAERPTGDARGDVYSLGATIYSLLVGRSPFEVPGRSNSPADLLSRIERSPLPTIDREDVPPGLSAVLARAMAKDPDRRFLSALALAHALQQVERSMHLPVTSIDLSQDILPDSSASRGDLGGPPGDGSRDDQVTRLRPVVSIDPDGGTGGTGGTGGASSTGGVSSFASQSAPAPSTRAQARAARRTQAPPPPPADEAPRAFDEDATRLRPITTITAQTAVPEPGRDARSWGSTDGVRTTTGGTAARRGDASRGPVQDAAQQHPAGSAGQQPHAAPQYVDPQYTGPQHDDSLYPSYPSSPSYPSHPSSLSQPQQPYPQQAPSGYAGAPQGAAPTDSRPGDGPAAPWYQGSAPAGHGAQPGVPTAAQGYPAPGQQHLPLPRGPQAPLSQQGPLGLPQAPFRPAATAFSPTPAEIRSQHYRKPSSDEEPGRRGPHRGWLVGAGALVVAALVVVGVLTLGRGADENPQAGDDPTSTPTSVEEATVPGPAKLTGVDQGDGSALFTWENPDEKDGDSYVWREVAVDGQGDARRTTVTQVEVPLDETTGVVCIEVSIVRQDGRASTMPVQECSR